MADQCSVSQFNQFIMGNLLIFTTYSLDAIFFVLFEERNELWSFRIKKMNDVILILMVIFLPCNTTQVILLILPIFRLKKKLLNYCV